LKKLDAFFHSKISKPNSSYIQQNTKISFDNIYQILFLVGATLGALISSVASGSYRAAPSISIVQAFIGGFLIIMGGRIASGCTSGHGISGFSKLSVGSFIAVPVMFFFGTLTALTLAL